MPTRNVRLGRADQGLRVVAHVVPLGDARRPRSDPDHPRALVAKHRGEEPLGVGGRERELVHVSDAGRADLYQYLALSIGPSNSTVSIFNGSPATNATAAFTSTVPPPL